MSKSGPAKGSLSNITVAAEYRPTCENGCRREPPADRYICCHEFINVVNNYARHRISIRDPSVIAVISDLCSAVATTCG